MQKKWAKQVKKAHKWTRKASAYLWRHHKEEIAAATLLVVLVGTVGMDFLFGPRAGAATYIFNQASWSGGLDTNATANHADNQSGWAKYSSSSAVSFVNGGDDVQLINTTSSVTQTDNSSTTRGFNLAGSSNSQTQITGTGDGASVKLGYQSSGWETGATLETQAISDFAVNSGGVYVLNYNKLFKIDPSTGSYDVVFTPIVLTGSNALANSTPKIGFYAGNIYLFGTAGVSCGKDCTTYYSVVDKYNATTGAKDTSFGNNGRASLLLGSNGTNTGSFWLNDIAVSESGIFISLTKQPEMGWRIEKRRLSDGSPDASFGQGGVLNVNPTGMAYELALDATGLYLSGYVTSTQSGYADGLIEKRDLVSGSLITSFGSGGSILIANDSAVSGSAACSSPDIPCRIIVDNGGLYARFNKNPGYRVRKFNATTGAVDNSFGSGGEISSASYAPGTVSSDTRDFAVGGDGVYITGFYATSTTRGTFVQKFNSTTGSIVGSFGVNSVGLFPNPSPYTGTAAIPSAFYSDGFVYTASQVSNPVYYFYKKIRASTGKTNDSIYYPSGTYTSGPVDMGKDVRDWKTLSWIQSGGQTITVKARTSATASFSGDWASCSNITNGANLTTGGCATVGHRYVQYQASLSTSDTLASPSLDSISINYEVASPTGTITSSPYDAGDPTNVMGGISWDEDADMPAGTGVSLSIRTASTSADLAAATWTSLTSTSTNCSKSSGTVTCAASAIPSSMKDGSEDRWFQYQVTLTSSGRSTPTVSAVRVTYVVNAPPQFNPDFGTNGVNVSQVATSTDPHWGSVVIQYSIRDTDSSFGSNTPGYVTPSFEYNTGSGWQTIPTQYLDSGATDNKAIDETTFEIFTAVWDVKTHIPGIVSSSTQVRVKVNDNEAANNLAQVTSPVFSIDTKSPIISTFRFDSTIDEISYAVSDHTNISYRFSNTYPIPTDAAWTTSTSSLNNRETWNPGVVDGFDKIYAEFRDEWGNVAGTQVTAPAAPTSLILRDTSNPAAGDLREFLSWKLYIASSSAAFDRYEIYRSTDDQTYDLLASVTNISQNFYTDASVATSTPYYYKVAIVDVDGDRSGYSNMASDTVDGQGGTDFTDPIVSNVQVMETQTTWARISWQTDEVADSKVEFSLSPSQAYNISETNISLVTHHEVVVSNLQPNTTYLFRVRSRDISGNGGMSDNGGQGYAFTTGSGPVITDVAIEAANDKSATIVWNTDRDSNSYIVYTTNLANLRTNTNISTAGSGGFVGGEGPLYQHRVTINGLNARTTYYYYVKSASAQNGYETIDNNGGNYYTFNTTYDARPPVITGVTVPIITQNSVSVIWQTDELANGKVEYGKQSGIYTNSSELDPPLSIYHIAAVSGLDVDTKYYFRVVSADSAGNATSSEESSFNTAKEKEVITVTTVAVAPPADGDTTPPIISDVKVGSIDSFSATVTFLTDEDTTAFVPHGPSAEYGVTAGEPNFKKNHSIKLARLRPGTTYNFRVQAMDKYGNMAASGNDTFQTKFAAESLDGLTKLDNLEDFQSQLENLIESTLPSLVPPVISEVEITDVTDKTATISWATNVKTYGSVSFTGKDEFDPAKDSYVSEMSDPTERTKEHKVVLTNLEPGTKYNFQVKSFILPGVTGKSKNRTFTTSASKIDPQIVKTGNDNFTVTWKTSVDTSSYVEYKNMKNGKVGQVGDDAKSMAHLVEVKNLEPAATYQVRVFGYDKNGTLVEGATTRVVTKQDTVAPEVTGITISNAFVPYRPNQLQTLISWKTNEPANSVVSFEEGVGVAEKLANTAGAPEDYTTQHTVILSSFKPGTVYRVKISSTDQAGNVSAVPVRTIITPSSNESVFDVILKNFEDSFGFLKNLNQ